jgi:biuret amidohydrolase
MRRVHDLDIPKASAQRSVDSLEFAGDAIFTDVEAFCEALQRQGG